MSLCQLRPLPIGGYGRILTQFHATSGLNVQLTWPGSVLIRYAMFGNIAFNRSFGTSFDVSVIAFWFGLLFYVYSVNRWEFQSLGTVV